MTSKDRNQIPSAMTLYRFIAFALFLPLFQIHPAFANPNIPTQAWSRDINAGGYLDGAPIGGFGAGTISWRFDGNFYLNRLTIGTGNDTGTAFTNDANAHFYMYMKPTTGAAVTHRLDAAALGSGQATYSSLFPESWVDYTGSSFPVKARVTQFSPLIPGDYQRVSYPVGVYQWQLTNPTAVSYDVAVMLTFANSYSGTSAALTQTGNDVGLVLTRAAGSATAENQGEFSIGSVSSGTVTVTRASNTTLANLETDFDADGLLSNTVGANTIGGLAFKVTIPAGQTVRIPIALSWDIPIAQAGTGNKWYREYTRYFGRTGLNSWAIADEALVNQASWETSLDNWENGILSNATYPNWLKSMLFNELYYYFTGGTYWEAGAASGQADNASEDMFSSLESYIYPFYGTSDVRFYSSWALILNWPDIDKQEVKQFCDSVWNNRTDRPQVQNRPGGATIALTAANSTAHDFGTTGTVFTEWNAYTYRDAPTWKDLNSKLVLMVYRDYLVTGASDTPFLNYCWRPVTTAMATVKGQDTDGDGLPNSNGIDQTYDDMDLTGNTAYCGGLFLAACQAAKQLALAHGDAAMAATYQSWFDLAQPNFESKLWTGSYYQIDTGSTDPTRIMSDQLCGQWYSKALGLGGIVSDAHAASAFQKIYDNNFSKFNGGANGVVNVMTSAGAIDNSTTQTNEAWVGTTWGAVAGMVQQGMTTQASNVGQSLFNTIWNTAQFWFRTPEAWKTGVTSTRAFYYMRACAIWGVKRAYDIGSSTTPVPTPTLTRTSTATPTTTRTSTVTPTSSPTSTRTSTLAASPTMTATLTRTSTATLTSSPTLTRSATLTNTPPVLTATSTVTLTVTRTTTPTSTASRTPTLTPSPTGTLPPSATSTGTASSTASSTSSATKTPTASLTASPTQTPTETSSLTSSPTMTRTASQTATPSATLSQTPSSTATATNSRTSTGTMTQTRTSTVTLTPTGTLPATSTSTASLTVTSSATGTSTATVTRSGTATSTPSLTPTLTWTRTLTAVSSSTSTATATRTLTLTPTVSSTPTPSPTFSIQPGATPIVIPNPSAGEPVEVLPQAYGGTSDVKVRIFTTAFRLVQEKTFQDVPAGLTVTVDMVDKWGQPLASGLYYVEVTTKKNQAVGKLLIQR